MYTVHPLFSPKENSIGGGELDKTNKLLYMLTRVPKELLEDRDSTHEAFFRLKTMYSNELKDYEFTVEEDLALSQDLEEAILLLTASEINIGMPFLEVSTELPDMREEVINSFKDYTPKEKSKLEQMGDTLSGILKEKK